MAENETQTGKTKKRKRDAVADAKNAAFDRARTAVQGIEANPVGALVGGLAIGLIAGALIPRGQREKTALKGVGKTLATGAVAALAAAKETSKEQLTASVLSRDAAKESARRVLDSALSAAKGKKGQQGGQASDAA